MTALALGDLHNVNSCYNYNTLEVNYTEIDKILNMMATRHSPALISLIRKMLERDNSNRPHILEVIDVTQ